MKRFYLLYTLILIFLLFPGNTFSQYRLDFGNVSAEDLSNGVYKPDPGADAVVLSDMGNAVLGFSNEFYVEFERNVRIRIINSNGFEYADAEIPYSSGDDLVAYKASTFNLKNGEKTETPIPKKSFIIEKSSRYRNILRFSFPDVHEGSVVEYSYILRLKGDALAELVPWEFQTTIPVVKSSLTVVYPEFFVYKTIISGNPRIVSVESASRSQNFAGQSSRTMTYRYSASNVPAFQREPFMKSLAENQTKVNFELASVNFPGSTREEITPTYETLTEKLLTRDDFGYAISKAALLKKNTEEIVKGISDELSKVKAVHKYISEKMLWNGEEDYTSSGVLKTAYNREKGNSADINMIMIAMLRSIGINADPVILSTRSNGSISQLSAMVSQFNYVVARVTINGEQYLVDATDPFRPFNMLPFECLNGQGRLINKYDSRFLDLKNSEITAKSTRLTANLSPSGEITADFNRRNSGYTAVDIRKQVQLEGEQGYEELLRSNYSIAEMTGLELQNLAARDSDVVESCRIRITDAAQQTGDLMFLNPYFCFGRTVNPFSSPERTSPIDFGCPVIEKYSVILNIPAQYEIAETPEAAKYTLGSGDAEYSFTCKQENNSITISSSLLINKTSFKTSEYAGLRDFFARMLQSQARVVVLKKKI